MIIQGKIEASLSYWWGEMVAFEKTVVKEILHVVIILTFLKSKTCIL